MPGDLDEPTRLRCAARVGELAMSRGLTVAVAESITGGLISTALARAERASEWYRGSLVAYSSAVKHELLGVPPGPVVSAVAASQMARRVHALLLADVAVAVTGAGGPSRQDGKPPGTVFLAVHSAHRQQVAKLDLPGDPDEVCAATALAALDALARELSRSGQPGPATMETRHT